MLIRKWNPLLALLLILASFGFAYPVYAETDDEAQPDLASEAAVLIDAKTGTVLYAHNPEMQEFPASITKITTGIIAIEDEQDHLQDLVTTSKEARNEEGTRIYLSEGEQQPLINLLYGMLMNSGNDAATAIAEFIDGSKAKFADRMNSFVREKIGALHTHYVNPSGLPDPEQYTTAMDMAVIARYAMQNDLFRTIVGTKKMPWNGQEWKSTLINHNEMLGNYEGTTGIKNGYTGDSGFTLVTSAKRDGMELIGVLLKSPTQSQLYKDMTNLLDYGFQHFEAQQVKIANQSYPFANAGEGNYIAKDPLYAVVPKGETPFISITAEGEVTVQTSLGTESAGWLQPVTPNLGAIAQRFPEIAASDKLEAKHADGASEPSTGSKMGIFIAWIGMIMYLCLFAYIRVKRQRPARKRSY